MEAFFPRAMNVMLPNGLTRHFEAGVNDIPEDLASHWWLRANGVTPRRIASVRPT